MSDEQFDIEWIDLGREPQCTPDPAYPNGKDIIAFTDEAAPKCTVKLVHPAPRIGVYVVTCNYCGLRFGATTAGRPDDPASIMVNCKRAPVDA